MDWLPHVLMTYFILALVFGEYNVSLMMTTLLK